MEHNQNEQSLVESDEAINVMSGADAPSVVPTETNSPAKKAPPSKLWLLVSGLVVVVLIVLIALIATHKSSSSSAFNENSNIKSSEYQALFLTNGQVYFGKLNDLDHQYVVISDIYYLQVQQNLQSGQAAANSTGSSVSLAKLGNELHGPEDKMYVARGQILFWENLKSNSSVVQAINKYQSSK